MKKLNKIHRNYIVVIVFLIALFSVYEWNDNDKKHIIEDQDKLIRAFHQSPNFHWLKDSNFVMLDLSDSYEKELLLPVNKDRYDYINFNDYNVWDSVTAKMFRVFDSLVLDCMCPIYQKEKTVFNGDTVMFRTVKFPVVFKDSSIGVGGTAFFNFQN